MAEVADLRIALAGVLMVMTFALLPVPSPADMAPAHAVVARSDGDALLLWDASSEVSVIVSTKLSDADANAKLKHDAIRVLAASIPDVSRDAKSVTIRVLFNKTGAVSPVYGAATFAGVEHYAEIKLSGPDFFHDRDRWRESSERAPAPAWLTLHVIGQLPPR
jgi:hypothetical protein